MKSFAAYVTTTGDHGQFTTNGLRFATVEEARAYADDLASRWFAVVEHEVRETEDPVNYVWQNGQAHSIDSWVPANGGAETWAQTSTGREALYVWQPSTGTHAWLGRDDLLYSDPALTERI